MTDMSISFHPGDATWHYSGFEQFRRRLAAIEGIDFARMEGEGCPNTDDMGSVWEDVDSDLAPLLGIDIDRSGFLDRWDCKQVSRRLREIITDWPNDHDKRQAEKMIAGMEHVVQYECALVY